MSGAGKMTVTWEDICVVKQVKLKKKKKVKRSSVFSWEMVVEG